MDGSELSRGGFGADLGTVEVEDGSQVQGGKLLLKNQWNTDLHYPLESLRQQGLSLDPPDVLFYKNHIYGVYSGHNEMASYLQNRGIKTLLFCGVNVEFCPLSTLLNANLMGFDTVLLGDCSGTTNGEEALVTSRQVCRKGWGFLSSSEEIVWGLEGLSQINTD